ncbi:MAG: hypothetical protein AAGB48_04125 [Planctomycetota bacterium]
MPQTVASGSHRTTASLGYRIVFVVAIVIAVAFGILTDAGTGLFEEGGAVERAQIGLWICTALIAAAASLRTLRRPDRAAVFLLGVLATVAAARELDAHIYLNPETLGDYGVRYRIDWWLDGAVNPLLKLAWAAAALAVLLLLAVPAFMARSTIWRVLVTRPRAFWLGLAAALCLATGFAVDDLLRGRIEIHLAHAIEESVELIGPAFYLAGLLALYAHAAARRSRADN